MSVVRKKSPGHVLAAACIGIAAWTGLPPFAAPGTSLAQSYSYGQKYYYYDDGYGQQWWKPARKKRPQPQRVKPAKRVAPADSPLSLSAPKTTVGKKQAEPAVADTAPKGPLVLVVSIKNQRVTVYDGNRPIAVSPISSGRVGNPTPLGVFSILEKKRVHHSNLYDDAPMPNMQRITWSGVALHAGVLPGYPASHGCIRLPHAFSQRLFAMTKPGARVIVTRDDIPVQKFSHAQLFATTAVPGDNKAAQQLAPLQNKVADASNRMVGSDASQVPGTDSQAAPLVSQVSPYRQKWLQEIDRRFADLKAADSAKASDTAALAALTQEAEAARDDARALRATSDALATALKKSEAERTATEIELDKFAKTMLANRRLNDDQVVSSAMREEALDSKLDAVSATIIAQRAELETARQATAAADQLVVTADTERKAQAEKLSKATEVLRVAQASVDEAKRREAKRQLPVAIFISRKTKMIYARQGFAPILEAPVEFVEPDKPVGTHVFTALSIEPNGRDLAWNLLSVPTMPDAPKPDKASKKGAVDKQGPVTVVRPGDQTAAAALDRVKIPDAVREQIGDIMKPGSSLILSDNGIGNETGPFTDFIVSLR